MKKLFTKEVKIGFAFIVALAVLYFGINFLKGINVFKPSDSYVVIFEDVTDLSISSPVLLNGYQVGQVYSMQLDPSEGNKVAVVVVLDKDIKIAKDSKIKLDVSLMGAASITISQNPLSKDFYSGNDKIPGVRANGLIESMSKTVLPAVDNLVPKVDSILTSVLQLVNNPALNQSLENMAVVTGDLAVKLKQLDNLLATLNRDVPQITNNAVLISGNLAAKTDELKQIDIQSTYKSLDASMKNVEQLTNKLGSKDNSLGLLLNDKALYDSLNITLGNAGMLLKDMKENPSKYINVKVF